MWVERFAPAKVNLFLHVGPVAPDGYHPVCSLMVFADVGDVIRLRDSARMIFRVEGPFADTLATDADNLVTRARDRLIAGLATSPPPFELVLDKRLPIAAGLGGGSADAAAALVLLNGRLGADPRRLDAIARSLGADVNACIASRSVVGRGRGDDIDDAPSMPVLDAILVNPRAPCATGAVYRAFDEIPAGPGADDPLLPGAFRSAGEVIDFLARTRNDLEAPAVKHQPLIGEVLADLAAAPETLLSRMSGSGATCFALVDTRDAAAALAARLSAKHPAWWIRPCRLGEARRAGA